MQKILFKLMAASCCAAALAGRGAASPGDGHVENALSLPVAIQLAISNNPALSAAAARVEAARGNALQARAWTNPDLEFSVEEWAVSRGFSQAEQLVGVAQTIPFPGKKKLDAQVGDEKVRVLNAGLARQRGDVVRDVKIAFYRVLAAQQLVGVQRDLVKVAEDSAGAARKRVEAGAAGDQEQLRAEIPLEQARSELAGFEQELDLSRHALFALIARPDLKDVPLHGQLAETAGALPSRPPEDWLTQQPSVVAARRARDQAEIESRRAALEPYPDVRVGMSGGRMGDTGDGMVQLRLAVPLPIFDRSKGRKKEAQANVRVAEADQQSVEQELLREWMAANRRVRTSGQQASAYRERILPKANDALRLVQSGFEQGKFGLLDLLDTTRTAAETRLAYQQKLLELNIALAQLESLTHPWQQ